MNNPVEYISYLRVSTKKQGDSGLGLDAQKEQIDRYVKSKGGVIIKEFVEIKSGTSRKRKFLKEAVTMSNERKAILIVAKLDRLARDTEFAHYILNNAHEIVAVDIPQMNKMIFGIFALMAEYERDLISKRTKDALDAKKRAGWVKVWVKERHNVGLTRMGAVERWEDKTTPSYSLLSTLQSKREDGCSLREIASDMNANGERTSTGSLWSAMAVKRILDNSCAIMEHHRQVV